MPDTGRTFIIFGIIITAIGVFMSYGPNIPFLGKLPGDIAVKRDNFSFYFPLTTSILLSLILSLLFRLFGK